MRFDYDLIVIGLGPAGMAVSIMASEMGLKVCAIEKNHIGGECMNVGCIPSKALVQLGKYRHIIDKFVSPDKLDNWPKNPFEKIRSDVDFIRDKKTLKMFDKVKLIYQQGSASFIDSHSVTVGDTSYSAKRIFICTGTKPQVPDFAGLTEIDYLTNETMFSLSGVPESLIVIGGGSIACEMAQSFARLGSQVTMIIRGARLIWRQDSDATDIIEKSLEADGVTILRKQNPILFYREANGFVCMTTDLNRTVVAEKLLVATGRAWSYGDMRLYLAGVALSDNGSIKVNKHLQTAAGHIYAAGDSNGFALLSHAAMHQGMTALINSMLIWPFKRNYKKYAVPSTVFTEPQFSIVGKTQTELDRDKISYEVIRVNYSDYGAAIAEDVAAGFVKAFISATGRIYGVCIIGEASGEMINEWSLAIQKKLRITDIMFLQHSFPTMGFLTKRISETWMMGKMKSKLWQKICQLMFRL